jgi:hypothetical protein
VSVVFSIPPAAGLPVDDLATFGATYKCAVVELLMRVHAHPNMDLSSRFLILDRADNGSAYVQCAFDDHDRSMLCEAASGFFAVPGEAPVFTPEQKQALAKLGFAMNEPRANFRQFLRFGHEPDYDAVADLLLTTLYEAYGARRDTVIEVTAPFAMPHGLLAKDRCSLVS